MPEPRQFLALVLIGWLAATPAAAHKLKLFASAEGAAIGGSAYFFGGGRAVGVAVTALAPDGALLAQAVTDGAGRFHITATRRVDHLLQVDSGDGHVASFTVTADTLPADLPGGGAGGGAVAASPPPPDAAPPSPPPALQALVEAAVARQVRPLREDIDAWHDEVRWHDVLGGLGTIFGIAGLAYGWMGRRQ